ncbi:MAG TPA: ATP-binding protein [Noviherbaspirillum sp.]|uniref:ATP-binding protein n=1 Tax=Noviherbaspirillum sp. TaxID=1926288 RepID=UPI002D47D0EA|nr:ATP-binding protein [Noviherbaspirillum sp.]HYD95909.1 ATP-binding protein [Noviherbaspirillum sp.]
MLANEMSNRRVLLIDDMPGIHQDFRKILVQATQAQAELVEAGAALFGDEEAKGSGLVIPSFEVDSAYQGQEGLAKVCESLKEGRPYAMAFVDMRMPPGWDGVETIERIWKEDERLQIVICTAYSDYSLEEVLKRLDISDRLLILKKPFDSVTVYQLANALTAKWELMQKAAMQMSLLEDAVCERTCEIKKTNEALQNQIAERQRLESQLIQSEKLASIGQLAAGVAHEINNPIGYISSNLGTLGKYLTSLFEMLQAYEEAEGALPAAEALFRLKQLRARLEIDYLKEDIPVLMQQSKDGVDRVRQIVQDLKDFSRADTACEWEYADLHQGIDSTLNIVASEIKYRADVVKEYGSIPDIECLPSQINQVIMNLVVNAAQAMGPERGRITIRTGSADGSHVWIEVEDTGSGISPENLPRIFDPFFTTKPIGKGTGLGLSLCYGIVQKHKGQLDVRSEPGKGTTFKVTLPVQVAKEIE